MNIDTGLLTGDRTISPDSNLIVATTEILRNMIYSDDKRLKKSALTFKIQTVKLPKRPTQSFFKTHLRQFVDKRGYYITKAPIYRIHGYGKDATITTSGFDHNFINIVVQSIENDYF